MTQEKIAELQKALAQGDKSFDFGASAELCAKVAKEKGVTPLEIGKK